MASLGLVVDHLKVDYKGIFDARGLFKTIAAWAFERDMEKIETKSHEHELENGKSIDYETYYSKRMTDYTIFVFKIKILASGLNKVDIVQGKKHVKMDQGKVLIHLDSFVQSDSEHKWDNTPFLVFLRTIFDKYIYKSYTERFEHHVTKLTHELYAVINKFLNIHEHPKLVKDVPKF